MQDWGVPGLAIAVVRGDSVVYAEGFGVRRVGEPEPVTPETLFGVASATKAFTAAVVGTLVAQGRVEWDDPVTHHLPGFSLFDPYVTRQLTVRDLLTHRAGLDRGDVLWYAGGIGREELIRRLRHLEPAWGFRERFGYQNLMYTTAGMLAAQVAGEPWAELVEERIFRPLGMQASSTSVGALAAARNVATPHAEIGGAVRPIPWQDAHLIAPSGGINSNVLEMSRWIRLNLSHGVFEGDTVLSPAVVREMHTPQMVVRKRNAWGVLFEAADVLTYGLGWFVMDYGGHTVVHHGGNIDGMSAVVAMVPGEDLGFVILTNMHSSMLPTALMYRVLDAYLGREPAGWDERLKSRWDRISEAQQARRTRREEGRIPGTRPSLPLERLAGSYTHPYYGDAVVEARPGGGVVFRYGELTADLEHWHHDTWKMTFDRAVLADQPGWMTVRLDAHANLAEVVAELPYGETVRFERQKK